MENIAFASIGDALYEQDYYAWTEQQAALLQAGRFTEIDLAHLIEEVEDMGRSQRRAVKSALLVVLIHLLKYRFQPTHRTQSWRTTLREHRRRLRDEFADSPSLKPYAEQVFAECYQDACEEAADETGLPLAAFPSICPFTLEQVLNRNFLPD
jgi:Domain of unknown function DUF29